MTNEARKMSAAEQAKAVGLPSLKWVADKIGKAENTLRNWHAENPALFAIVLTGAEVVYRAEQEQAGKLKAIPTSVPRLAGNDAEAISAWLAALDAAGLLWHMDDSAQSVEWGALAPTRQQIIELEADRVLARGICERFATEIFDLYPAHLIRDEEV